jgi:hypothetical protein
LKLGGESIVLKSIQSVKNPSRAKVNDLRSSDKGDTICVPQRAKHAEKKFSGTATFFGNPSNAEVGHLDREMAQTADKVTRTYQHHVYQQSSEFAQSAI